MQGSGVGAVGLRILVSRVQGLEVWKGTVRFRCEGVRSRVSFTAWGSHLGLACRV